MEWIWNNKEWVFCGIGAVVITFISALIRYLMQKNKSKKTDNQVQIISGRSTGIQVGRDYNETKSK